MAQQEVRRWRFVKRDEKGVAIIVTDYDCPDGPVADEVLAHLKKSDFLSIKIGQSWGKIPAEERPCATPQFTTHADTTVRTRNVVRVSEETYEDRMAQSGIGRDEARRLKEVIDRIL